MSADKRELPECPKCGAPCTRTVLMRGGENGWSTTDEERAEYRYAHSRAQDSGGEAVAEVEDFMETGILIPKWCEGLPPNPFPAGTKLYATPPPKVEAQQGLVVDGISLIAAERDRQVSSEGWTPTHDDAYSKLELVRAAVAYALHGTNQRIVPDSFWPWHLDWWRPSDNVRNLVKAGALIAAEIDRIRRAAALAHPPQEPQS